MEQYNGIKIYKTIKEAGGHLSPRNKDYIITNAVKLCRCNNGYIRICKMDNCHNISVKHGDACAKHQEKVIKLQKPDIVYLLKDRKIEATTQSLYAMNVKQLKQLLGETTKEEKNKVLIRKEQRIQYGGNITYNCGMYGIPQSYTKSAKIDCLLNLDIKTPIQLNSEQQIFISKLQEKNKIIGLSGPGGGKTQTLISIVSWLASNHSTNILVLMFNVNIERQFKSRLRGEGIKIQPRTKVRSTNGVYVTTFHKYAYHSRLYKNKEEFEDYDLSIQNACNIAPSDDEIWDYVIVDEAQDIKPIYQTLIDTIRTRKTIFMGDARQQIIQGVDTYSQLISNNLNNVNKLVVNHRSRPEIVDILNKFSKANFSSEIDIQQISSLYSEKESIIIVRGNEAELVSKYVLDYPEGSTFIITPVSTNKYNMSDITTEIRQILYENGRKINIAESGRELDPYQDYITNSYLIKGLEKDQVILYGVSNTELYIDYTIQRYNLQCLLYVAMSRAKNRLVIVIDDDKYTSPNLLDCVLEGHISLESININIPRKISKPSTITVTDLSEYNFPIIIPTKIPVTKLHFDRSFIEDCSGIYIEACIAHQLGCLKKHHQLVRGKKDLIYLLDNILRYEINCSDEIYNTLYDIFQDINNSDESPEYKYLRASYVCKIKRNWSVSEKLRDIRPDLTSYIDIVRQILSFNEIKHQRLVRYNIPIDRSEKFAGTITGALDFSDETNIIELKHAFNNYKHYNQSAIYSTITNQDTFLLNTLEGFYCKSSLDMTIDNFNHYVRAIFMLRESHITRIGAFPTLPSGIIISLDTEYYEGKIYEIGAVVIDISNMKILEVYQKTSGCVPYINKSESLISENIFSELTGLRIVNEPNFNDFQDFYYLLNKYPNSPLIQWGSGDCELLNIHNRTIIDLSHKYRIYKSIMNDKFNPIKSGYRLIDAVQHIFSPLFQWEPHRAFEDAVMTAAVYYCLTVPR